MRELAAFVARRGAVRVALTGLIGVWLAGCSADSDRFSASLRADCRSILESFRLERRAQRRADVERRLGAARAAGPCFHRRVPFRPGPGAVRARAGENQVASSQPVGGPAAGWSIVGGSPIVVAQGDDAESVSRRYGVPTSALIKSNGLTSGSQIHAGMHLVIPVYSASGQPGGAKPKKVAAADDADVAPGKHAKAKGAKERRRRAKTTEGQVKGQDRRAAKTRSQPTAELADKQVGRQARRQDGRASS